MAIKSVSNIVRQESVRREVLSRSEAIPSLPEVDERVADRFAREHAADRWQQLRPELLQTVEIGLEAPGDLGA